MFHEAEARLAEHAELRGAFGFQQTPAPTILSRFIRRVAHATGERVLHAVATHWPAPLGGHTRQKAMVAIEATGLAPGSTSTFFVNRQRGRGMKLT